jgi:hypothetical protein
MKIRYYVCALGYDAYDCITDYEQNFGDFDTYEEAYECFVRIQCADVAQTFMEAPEVRYWLLEVEECEDCNIFVECIDVKNEWYINNPHFKEV